MTDNNDIRREKYEEYALSNFPESVDVFDKMSDVSVSTFPLVIEYNELCTRGDWDGANKLLADNPKLLSCVFNALKYNKLGDAVSAIQRFSLEEFTTFINNVAQAVIGINDTPANDDEALVNAFSGKKVIDLIRGLNNVTPVTLYASNWSGDEAPYTQSIIVDEITSNDNFDLVDVLTGEETEAQVKAYKKAFGYIFTGETFNGSATFYAYKIPPTDISVGLLGLKGV